MSGIGLALPESSTDDRFMVGLVQALAGALVRHGVRLVTKVVPDAQSEKELYDHWAKVGGISGVALLGVGSTPSDSARVELLRSLGFPVAAVVDTTVDADFPSVVVDYELSIEVLRAFLETRRHRRTVYISAVEEGAAVTARSAAADNALRDGLFEVVHIAHTVDAAVTAATGAQEAGPVTLVFDSDVHAAAALAAFRARDIRVPHDVAIVSWTNSALCQSASQSITAIDRRGGQIGALLGNRILGAVAGDQVTHDRAPRPFVVVGETA